MKFMLLGYANKDTEAGVLPITEEFEKMAHRGLLYHLGKIA